MNTPLPEPDINTASHINTRIVGYTADKVRQYAATETKRITAELQEMTAERDAQRKVLEQALEALQDYQEHIYRQKTKQAITAIQEQLNEHN